MVRLYVKNLHSKLDIPAATKFCIKFSTCRETGKITATVLEYTINVSVPVYGSDDFMDI